MLTTDGQANRYAGLAPAARQGLAEEVCGRLREAIFRLELAPGERLGEVELAEALSVSRGPVREALVRLQLEGLVTRDWHRGACVTELSLRGAEEIYSLRMAIESLAMKRAVRYAGEADIAGLAGSIELLANAVRTGDKFEMVRMDIAFHDGVYRAANNSRLYEAWTNLRSQVTFYLAHRQEGAEEYPKSVVSQHRGLLATIVERDEPAAIALAETHLEEAYERLRSRFQPEADEAAVPEA